MRHQRNQREHVQQARHLESDDENHHGRRHRISPTKGVRQGEISAAPEKSWWRHQEEGRGKEQKLRFRGRFRQTISPPLGPKQDCRQRLRQCQGLLPVMG